MAEGRREEFTFEIVEHICVLGKGREEGFRKEFNRVSFRGLAPKWDIREWNRDHTRMTKGMTLTDDEMKTILEALAARKKSKEAIAPEKEELQKEATVTAEVPETDEATSEAAKASEIVAETEEAQEENGTDTE